MKLLAIKIVANNFFGRSSSLIKIWSFGVKLLWSVSKSVGLRENRATSEPDIKAEQSNNITKIISLIISVVGMLINKNKLEGSGSNLKLNLN